MIQVDQNSIRKAVNQIREEYKHISGDLLNTAISRTINRAADASKTLANSEIRKKYNISQADVSKEFTIRRSTKGTLTAIITAKGSPLSLTKFQAKQVGERATTSFDRKGRASSRLTRKSRSNAVKGVSAVVKKGQTINLPFAFIQVSNGAINVFARGKYAGDFQTGRERLPIAKMTTTAIPLMFGSSEVMDPTLKLAEFDFSKRFEQELKNLMRI